MHQEQIERLREQGKAIRAFLLLEPYLQDELWPIIPRGVRSTIALLDAISDLNVNGQPKSYEELAAELDCHPTTVSQKLNVLADFFPIKLEDETAHIWYQPSTRGGRPRRIAVKEE